MSDKGAPRLKAWWEPMGVIKTLYDENWDDPPKRLVVLSCHRCRVMHAHLEGEDIPEACGGCGLSYEELSA